MDARTGSKQRSSALANALRAFVNPSLSVPSRADLFQRTRMTNLRKPCCRAPGRTVNQTVENPRRLRENERSMVTLDTLRREKKAEILRLAEMHGCYNIRVFGSVATGENRPDSDVDFLVDIESGRTLFDLGGLLSDLRDLLGIEVDIVESRSIHPYIRDRVLAEAVNL